MNLLIFNLKTDADDSVLGFTTDWINALATRCERVVVITMMVGRLAVASNVKVFSVGKEKGYSEPRRLLEFYRILWGVLRNEKIDACFAHMMPLFAVFSSPFLKKRGIPILLWYTHSHISLLLRIATRLVDRVVSANESGFRINTKKVKFIGHAVNADRFSPSNEARANHKIILITVGRISPVKQLQVPLRALALLPADLRARIELRYVGDPMSDRDLRYASQLKRDADLSGLGDSVSFRPGLPFYQIHLAYQDADLFVNTSSSGGLDKAILEAMSCGLPVITCNASMRDILGPDLETKCFVSKCDGLELSKKLENLLTMDASERRNLGMKMRELVLAGHSLQSLSDRIFLEIDEVRSNKSSS